MRWSRISSRAALGAWAMVATALGAEPMKGGIPYRVSIDSELSVSSGAGAPMKVRAQADFDYRLARSADRVESAVDRMTMTATMNGREASHAEMSRSGIVSRERGQDKTMGREGAAPKLLALLDQFEAPLAVFTLDPEGAEVRRELKFEEGPLIDSDLVDNTRIFHPKFSRDKAEWDAKALFPLGKGQKARGTLHYAKRPGKRADGRVEVAVNGRLEVSGKMGQAAIKKGDYKVSGVQVYDPALGDWDSGKLTVDMEFEGVTPAGVILRGSGPVTLDLARRPDAGGPEGRPRSTP